MKSQESELPSRSLDYYLTSGFLVKNRHHCPVLRVNPSWQASYPVKLSSSRSLRVSRSLPNMETLTIIYATQLECFPPWSLGALTLESATLCCVIDPQLYSTLSCAHLIWLPAVVIARTGRVETDNSSAVDEASLPPSESQQFRASRTFRKDCPHKDNSPSSHR